MKILKFGGTSVGSVENLLRIEKIIGERSGTQIIVCSAMSGVTDHLVKLAALIRLKDQDGIIRKINDLEIKHLQLIEDLFDDSYAKVVAKEILSNLINELHDISNKAYDDELYSQIITSGELLLTSIFSEYLNSKSVSNKLLYAKDFMYVDSVEVPNIQNVRNRLTKEIEGSPSEIYITQGFVCRLKNNKLGHLNRGGSDFTATIIGAALDADEVQIWTDIDGLHNNDPRFVDSTYPISDLTYDEAAELAYFGAKILHPQTVSPVVDKDIPVLLKNTFDPSAEGTVISNRKHRKGLKAISAKDDITAIKIKSNRMLMAHGYLKQIFEVFDNYHTSIDMITTSEIAISLTIDNDEFLEEIVDEIQKYADVSVDQNHSIICIVGESVINDKNSYKLFEILNYIPVRMISYGGSNNNISLLVDTKDKIPTLRFLNEKLFEQEQKVLV